MTGAFETVFSLMTWLTFYRECVAPDIATGYIRMKEDILEVNDIWGSLNGKTNPARLVTLRDTTDPTLMSTVGCDAAYLSLTTQINAESNRQITLLGYRLYPQMTQADAGAAILGSLATSTNYLLGVSHRRKTRSNRPSSPTS